MEPRGSYKPWHDKQTHKTYLKPDDGKCLHYYVYFIDEDLGLCSLRIPAWCPFRLQFYCNGHSVLAGHHQSPQMRYRNIVFKFRSRRRPAYHNYDARSSALKISDVKI
jgi:hypothetical protein